MRLKDIQNKQTKNAHFSTCVLLFSFSFNFSLFELERTHTNHNKTKNNNLKTFSSRKETKKHANGRRGKKLKNNARKQKELASETTKYLVKTENKMHSN